MPNACHTLLRLTNAGQSLPRLIVELGVICRLSLDAWRAPRVLQCLSLVTISNMHPCVQLALKPMIIAASLHYVYARTT